ncbi:MAG TPA: hypothetical protein VM784_14780 [Actinomycetota bacterium]|nr:hypothetical protein [Actinomycetota bacterium]
MSLTMFQPPGNLAEMSADSRTSWDARVRDLFDVSAQMFLSFYNPVGVDVEQRSHRITWPAAPGRLLSTRMSAEQRWAIADADRNEQDEYCEWSLARDNDGKIQRVTFTSEVPDYFDHLLHADEALLLELYGQMSGRVVPIDALRAHGGNVFVGASEFNSSTDGPIVHLSQRNNNLRAAITLTAEATILREIDGQLLSHPQTLVLCGRLGDERRHSDPQIGAAVNGLVAAGADVSLADPPGLYLDGIVTGGLETPDGTDPQEFWHVERGDADHVVRAVFEVPGELGYKVGDITIAGRPINFGAQLAERVHVRVEALSKKSFSAPMDPLPCVA